MNRRTFIASLAVVPSVLVRPVEKTYYIEEASADGIKRYGNVKIKNVKIDNWSGDCTVVTSIGTFVTQELEALRIIGILP